MSEPAPALGIELPFKGLMPYAEQDAAWFFGRGAEVELVIANLHSARLTLFYGMSGAGKSSVLRAGVVHSLREEAASSPTPECIVVYFRSWLGDVSTRLGDEIRLRASESTREPLQLTAASSLVDICAEVSRVCGCKLLLLLDQFEEYFLYHPDDTSFDDTLSRVINHPDLSTNVLISLREDSLSRLDRFKGKLPGLFANYLRIKHLDRRAAKEAIERPLERYNELHPERPVKLEPGLVEHVLDAVTIGRVQVGEAGRGMVDAKTHRIEAPYLQLVMTRLWRDANARNAQRLVADDLTRLGGAASIVQTHLLEVMRGLTAEQQRLAADVFHYLVTPSGTKIAYSAADLAALTGKPIAQVAALLQAFTSGEQRILRVAEAGSGSTACFEIFHDVLGRAILEWRRQYRAAIERERLERLGEERARAQLRARLKTAGYVLLAAALASLALWAWYNASEARRYRRAQEIQAEYFRLAQAEAQSSAEAAAHAKAEVERANADTLAKQEQLLKELEACTHAGAPEAERLRKELAAAQINLQRTQKRAEELQRKAQTDALVEFNASAKSPEEQLKQQLPLEQQYKSDEELRRTLKERHDDAMKAIEKKLR